MSWMAKYTRERAAAIWTARRLDNVLTPGSNMCLNNIGAASARREAAKAEIGYPRICFAIVWSCRLEVPS
jgi:hypothetical protein